MTDKPRKPKYRYTRELIRIALEEMTQQEVADLCRVSQSIVSGWRNGRGRASEHQIAELKRRYGSRLNRATSRVYLTRSVAVSDARWEESPRAKRLLALHRQARKDEPFAGQKAKEFEALESEICPDAHVANVRELAEIDREQFEEKRRPVTLVHVEGPVVLRHAFCRPVIDTRAREPVIGHEPVVRWVIHHQGRGRFVWLVLRRRSLGATGFARWEKELEEAAKRAGKDGLSWLHRSHADSSERWIETADDAGRWIAVVEGPFDDTGLLAAIDVWIADPKEFHGPHDEVTAPLLVRKMLVEQGYDVPGVIRMMYDG